jgi:hypothetical protein
MALDLFFFWLSGMPAGRCQQKKSGMIAGAKKKKQIQSHLANEQLGQQLQSSLLFHNMDSELRAQVLTLLALLAQKYTNNVAPAVVPALLHNVRDTERRVQVLALLTLLLSLLVHKYRCIYTYTYMCICACCCPTQ